MKVDLAVIMGSLLDIHEVYLSLGCPQNTVGLFSLHLTTLERSGSIPPRQTSPSLLHLIKIHIGYFNRDGNILRIHEHIKQIRPQQLLMDQIDKPILLLPRLRDGLVVDQFL